MGGGRRELLPNVTGPLGTAGRRIDGLDLTEMWHVDKQQLNVSHQFVTDRLELMKVCALLYIFIMRLVTTNFFYHFLY